MPRYYDSRRTDARDAAAILRNLAARVSGLEQESDTEGRTVQQSRQITEVVEAVDAVTIEEGVASNLTYDIDKYGRAEWGGGDVEDVFLTVPIFATPSLRTTVSAVQEVLGPVSVTGRGRMRTTTEKGIVQSESYTGVLGRATPSMTETKFVAGIVQERYRGTTIDPFMFMGETATETGGEDVPSGSVNLNEQGLSEGDDIQDYWNFNSTMTVDPGTYKWDGEGRTFDGIYLWGKGNPGDVVLEFKNDSSTEGTSCEAGGGFHNILISGDSTLYKPGVNIYRNAHVRRFFIVHGDHGVDEETRHFYTPEGNWAQANAATIEQSAWAHANDNGAYVDKAPVNFKNCAAWDNNVANIRIGNRDGTPSGAKWFIDQTVIAALYEIKSFIGTSCRGLRPRHPCDVTLTECLWHFRDISGLGGLIESEVSGVDIHLDHCVFWNDSSSRVIKDDGGGLDVFIDGPVIVGGPGRLDMAGDIIDPDDNLEIDASLPEPVWDWRAVTYGQQSPVAPYFNDVSGDPTQHNGTFQEPPRRNATP